MASTSSKANPRSCILVTGSREWTDVAIVRAALASLHAAKESVLLTGGARGADSIAAYAGRGLGLLVEVTPYFHWCDRAGGPMRNALLVDKLAVYAKHGYHPRALAFLRGEARGTRGCVRLIEDAGFGHVLQRFDS